jgi:error-prone DNA polymerase
VVLIRQRPGKGNAIFITIEDETGIANVLLWARDLERQRRAVMSARLMVVEGVIQKSDEGVVHLMATQIHDRTALLGRLSDNGNASPQMLRADVINNPQPQRAASHPRNARIMPHSRDFR